MPNSARTPRIRCYKNNHIGTTELRRKRVELSVALRKQARDEHILKRRAVSPIPNEGRIGQEEKLLTPEEIVQGLKSSDLAIRTLAARGARRILSREQNPPINMLVQAGALKPLVDALDCDECPDLQFEASWAITNIASGTDENSKAVIDSGAVPKLVSLLYCGGAVGEQCAWALGNIAGDGAAARDLVLAHGVLPAIMPALSAGSSSGLLRTAVWTYSNLCRNKTPMVDFDLVSPALPNISELLYFNDKDVLADACWAISYLTDGPNDRIEAVQATPGLLPRLHALLAHSAPAVKTPALRAVGNMLTGSDEQTDRCISAGCLGHIVNLLRSGKPSLMKEAAWAASNILAGTERQIQTAVESDLLPSLVQVLKSDDVKCQKEAAWAITNLTMGGNARQLDALFTTDALEPFCALLGSPDKKTVVVVLDGIANLCQAAAKYGQLEAICVNIEQIGALDVIESLQQHENELIYQKVLHILDTYFAEQEDVTAQPTATAVEFKFGITQHNQNIQF